MNRGSIAALCFVLCAGLAACLETMATETAGASLRDGGTDGGGADGGALDPCRDEDDDGLPDDVEVYNLASSKCGRFGFRNFFRHKVSEEFLAEQRARDERETFLGLLGKASGVVADAMEDEIGSRENTADFEWKVAAEVLAQAVRAASEAALLTNDLLNAAATLAGADVGWDGEFDSSILQVAEEAEFAVLDTIGELGYHFVADTLTDIRDGFANRDPVMAGRGLFNAASAYFAVKALGSGGSGGVSTRLVEGAGRITDRIDRTLGIDATRVAPEVTAASRTADQQLAEVAASLADDARSFFEQMNEPAPPTLSVLTDGDALYTSFSGDRFGARIEAVVQQWYDAAPRHWETDGKTYTLTSNGARPNVGMPRHPNCSEARVISRAVVDGVDVYQGRIITIDLGTGEPMPSCRGGTCRPLLNDFGVRRILPLSDPH